MLTYTNRGGEMLAVDEFNASQNRSIERINPRQNDPPKSWHKRMFALHVLDHPARHVQTRNHLMHIATDFI